MSGPVLLGVDVGGTKTHGMAFDRGYRPLAEVRAPTTTGGEAVADQLTGLIDDLSGRVGARPIAAIGVGIPGVVDRERGQVRAALNLGIGERPLDLVARVEAASGVPCQLDNDVNVGALGARQLLDPGLADLAYLSIGTGVAAGVILDGALRRGERGVAGEIGHFPVQPDGPVCDCGLRGCLEAVASGRAIARHWPAGPGRSPAASLLVAADAGDEAAVAAAGRLGDHLATAVHLLSVTFDVGRVIVGGGVSDLGRRLIDLIRAGLRRLESRSALIRALELPDRVTLRPDGPVGALGAAVLAAEAAR